MKLQRNRVHHIEVERDIDFISLTHIKKNGESEKRGENVGTECITWCMIASRNTLYIHTHVRTSVDTPT